MARILIEAIQNGQENLARDIIMKSGSFGGIDCQTSRRNGTALFFCSSRGYLELAKLLLDRGASVDSTDKNRATPLHGAVDNGHLEVVKLLICNGANINVQTYRGDTPLHLAAYRGFVEITQCLMEAGADPRVLNANSFTAENEARGRGHHGLCGYLRPGVHNVLHLADTVRFPVDSMVQLDPPSLASITSNQQPEVIHQKTTINQQVKKSQNSIEVDIQRNLSCPCEVQLSSQRNLGCPCEVQLSSQRNLGCPCEAHLSSQRNLGCPCEAHLSSQRNLSCPCEAHLSSQRSLSCQCEAHLSSQRNLGCPCEAHLNSPYSESESDKFNNLSAMSLDLPSTIPSKSFSISQRKRLGQRHSLVLAASPILLPSLEGSTDLLESKNLPSPVQGTVTPSASSSSNVICLNSLTGTSSNKHTSASQQFLFPLASNYNIDGFRRPSAGSGGSYFSDISFGTGSDTGSLPSTGSDGSGYLSDIRHEDVELNESSKLDDHWRQEQDQDLVLLSLGVRNPPVQKHKRQLSTASESTDSLEFSDIYDSTLFSLTSMVSGSRSSSISGIASAAMDFTETETGKNYSRLSDLEHNQCRPRLNRATSANCPLPSHNITLKVRPSFNKSISTEYRSKVTSHAEIAESRARYDRLTSNDLSSFTMADKSSCSMTCVNIPLN